MNIKVRTTYSSHPVSGAGLILVRWKSAGISHRRTVKFDLRASDAHISAIFETLNDGVSTMKAELIDENGKTRVYNVTIGE